MNIEIANVREDAARHVSTIVNRKSQIVNFLLFFLCILPLRAQDKHEISLSAFSGLSHLKHTVTEGSSTGGFGGGFGLGYVFLFTERFGLRTGAELAFYGSEYRLENAELKYATTDYENAPFEFRSKICSYTETHRATMLQIPLMLQYQSGVLHVAFGAKAGIPVAATAKTGALCLHNSGFYHRDNFEYDTQTFMGFGTFTLPAATRDLTLKTAVFLSLEAGGKFALSGKLSFYAGVFLDYGLTSIVQTRHATSLQLVEYNAQKPREFGIPGAANTGYISKINPIAVGVKMRIGR